MFDGVPVDHLHQLIASRTTTTTTTSSTSSLPPPLSFSSLQVHGPSSTNAFTSFDPYHQQAVPSQLHPNFLHPLHHQQQSPTHKNEGDNKQNNNKGNNFVATNLEIERERSIDPWSSDEVLALLRIRSTMENWFPEYTWEHVSRKLAQVGFKRSAEKCKEKFEEESSRYFNNNANNFDKNYRIFSELEEVYHGEHDPPQVSAEKNKKMDKPSEEEDKIGQEVEEDSRNNDQTVKNPYEGGDKIVDKQNRSSNKKRKREKKFEMFKSFCEDIVRKMMAQQEEMHSKLIEDMVKRDEEKLAREEAWKKKEMERFNKELEMRAQEQAVACDRQSILIKFLKTFTSSSSFDNQISGGENLVKVLNSLSSPTSSSLILAPNPTPIDAHTQNNIENSGSSSSQVNPIRPTSLTENSAHENPSSSTLTSTAPKAAPGSSSGLAARAAPRNPNSLNTQENPSIPNSMSTQKAPQNPTLSDKDDIGKRWPRDEVLALINIRCNLYKNGEDKEGATTTAKAPLWERISQGMLELGYKRSAKRCKEKWENINKYFRKTKDVNKKRSLDSRTCPYFHKLSTLYNQGTFVTPPPHELLTENPSSSPENHSSLPESGPQRPIHHSTINVAEGEKQIAQAQAPAFDFEF